MNEEPSFTIGIEEEYLLVDRETRDLVADPPPSLMAECEAVLGDAMRPEFLRCQIEVGSSVHSTLGEARAEMAKLRRSISDCAGAHGMALIAASTHPFADWSTQRNTDKARYNDLARDMQVLARRLLICGMHVHVAVEDELLRFDLFNQLPYFLPHLLALSGSSPFWRGAETGLQSYRLSVLDELPRTGLPPSFMNAAEYHRTVELLVHAGEIEDATKVWWDIRPSARFPTLEMRITDVCPLLDDAIAIAALYRCIVRMLYRLRRDNQRWRYYSAFLVSENRWLAQRFGTGKALIDFGKGEPIPFVDLVEELIALLAEDAEHFGCAAEVARAREIAANGTSASRQLAIFREKVNEGASEHEALVAVVDHLMAESLVGCDAKEVA